MPLGKSGLGIEAQRNSVAEDLNGGNWKMVSWSGPQLFRNQFCPVPAPSPDHIVIGGIRGTDCRKHWRWTAEVMAPAVDDSRDPNTLCKRANAALLPQLI